MIAEALRLEIEDHARRVRAENPMLLEAAAGRLAPAAVGRYLASLRYLIGLTPHCLTRARDLARAGGLLPLARYFSDKLAEEDGHERWAEQDLRVLGATFPDSSANVPVPAIVELGEFVMRTIETDPTDYLAYILWAEYFTVLAGGDFIAYLTGRCGIPKSALTCLVQHVELDVDHVDEGMDAIDRLVTEPWRLERMREVVRRTIELFDRAADQMLHASTHVPMWPARAVG